MLNLHSSLECAHLLNITKMLPSLLKLKLDGTIVSTLLIYTTTKISDFTMMCYKQKRTDLYKVGTLVLNVVYI